MATIDTVTDSGEVQAAETAEPPSADPSRAAVQVSPVPAASVSQPGLTQQRPMTLVVTVFGTVITALLGGMFLFMVSAIDDVRDEISTLRVEMSYEIGSLRSEMNARFAEVDRKFDQINAVLMDHSDRLARIETSLDISGRPLNGETSDIAEP